MSEHKNNNVPGNEVPEGIARCSVNCPMCGHRHVQHRINPQLYWFTDMDVDRKPTGFHCRMSLEGYYPPLYELWHCPQCHYTAHNRVFPDPLKHVYIEKGMVARKLADLRKSDPRMGRITEALGAEASFEKSDFVQAVRLAALEIYFLKIVVDILHQGHESVARSYLRLAWLYRDWDAMQPERTEDRQRLAQIFDSVATDWPDCPRGEKESLEEACKWFGVALGKNASTQDPVESCGMMAQVARIRMKMGQVEEARVHLADCQKTIMAELDTTTRAMNEDLRVGALSEEQRGRMLTDSRKLRALLDECRGFMDEINRNRQEAERKRAARLAEANSRLSGAALRKLLEDGGISPAVIREFVPEKKEGLFGGLFR